MWSAGLNSSNFTYFCAFSFSAPSSSLTAAIPYPGTPAAETSVYCATIILYLPAPPITTGFDAHEKPNLSAASCHTGTKNVSGVKDSTLAVFGSGIH